MTERKKESYYVFKSMFQTTVFVDLEKPVCFCGGVQTVYVKIIQDTDDELNKQTYVK